MALEQPTSPHPVAPTADAVPSFVQSLHTMLQVEDASIIRWTPDGQAFEILDQRMLANRILHRYFRHTKYASFQRQLNYFGFRKWPKQKAAICTYSQLYFSRDNPADLHRIKRRVKASLLDAGQVNATPLVDCSVEVSDASFLPAASHGFLTSAEDLDSLVTTLNTNAM
ncbi:hypothetical protein H310_05674 [Aphanomyces invadans]|uniref:HSF-type DNA-binding domain-containing protein n=1 Tax=Aphanomyces invadans TaxID=157072 RepID=A0A024U838_9STRA|nr:hypothetical protein H310_05674 [Aphanomyces invadans]ETW02062.1 hypothetical protein H310_05674 [Aphanomyces invadans]|eukprot:XP_008868667.1 hypothetical protein H310_05674 [Aphanomyces invadans]